MPCIPLNKKYAQRILSTGLARYYLQVNYLAVPIISEKDKSPAKKLTSLSPSPLYTTKRL